MFRRLPALAIVALITACAGPEGAPTTAAPVGTTVAPAAEVTEIIVLLPNPSAMNVFNLCAAIGEGFLAEQGIQAQVEAVDGSGPVLQAMATGQAQIGLPGPGPMLNAWARGEEPVGIYNHFAQALFGIVVPDDSEYLAPADLAGTTIGVGTAEGAEVSFARSILAGAGLEEETDYQFLSVGDGGPATAAFERGEIAAYAAAISDMAIIEARGLPLRELTPEEFLSFFGNGYAAMRSYIDESPGVVQGFVNAMVQGAQWALDDKEGTLAHCADLNPEEGSDTELTSALYDAVISRAQPLGGLAIGEYSPEAWEAWQNTLLETGELEEAQDLSAVYTNEFVEVAHGG